MARPGPEPGHSGPPFSAASDTCSFRAGFGRSLLCLFKGHWFPCWNIIFQLPFQDYLMCPFQCTFNLSWITYWKLHFQTRFHINLIISFQHAFQACWYVSWECLFQHVFQLLPKRAKNRGAFHSGHVDSNGACTMLMTNSPKIFIIPVVQPIDDVGPSEQGEHFQPHSSQTFESIFLEPFVGGDKWRWEAFALQRGQLV